MTSEDMLALDGAFKRLARAQGVIGRLAEEGAEKTMTHRDRDPWGDFPARLEAARAESDAAFHAVETLYGSPIAHGAGG